MPCLIFISRADLFFTHTSLSLNTGDSEKLTIVNNLLMAAAIIVFLPDSNRAVPQEPVTIFIIVRQTLSLFFAKPFDLFGGAQ